MRKVRIEQWCDFCWQDGEQETPATRTWTVGALESESNRPALKVVETCELHSKILDELVAILGAAAPYHSEPGPKPKQPALFASRRDSPSKEAHECPICGDVLRHKASLVSHVWNFHRPDERPPAPTRCPTCGHIEKQPTTLGQHRRYQHDYDPLQDVLSGVPGYRTPKTGR
jgi:uncharacterized C2H2 Zn-finger protein